MTTTPVSMSACCNQVNMETLTLRTTYIGGRHSAVGGQTSLMPIIRNWHCQMSEIGVSHTY